MLNAQKSGVVLMGHGSREPATEAEIKDLAATLGATLAAENPGLRVAHAFLNSEPKLEAAVASLVAEGCTTIRVLPLLVFIGRHMIDDVPTELERLRDLHPTVTFSLDPYLFRLPGFSALLAATLNAPPTQDFKP
jgi:sirohydrochlorin cobaltochelatase